MDRLERLVNLLVALMDTPRPLSRDDLRQRVGGYSGEEGNFRRNFERDKELLRELGIPVVAEPLDPGRPDLGTGYRVPRDRYELPDPGLSEEELRALAIAVSAVVVEGAEPEAARFALWKLAAASSGGAGGGTGRPPIGPATQVIAPAQPVGAAGRSTPGPRGLEVDVAVDERAAVLFGAMAERRVVTFGYSGVGRRVSPYHLAYRQGHWYLTGFDHGRQHERVFRVDRIEGAVATLEAAGAFDRPVTAPSGPPPPWRLGDDEETEVELRVDPGQAPWVQSVAGADVPVRTAADGTRDFTLAVTNRAAFRGFVLGLLDHAEVLGPPAVRAELTAWLTDLAGAGGGPPPAPRAAPVPAAP